MPAHAGASSLDVQHRGCRRSRRGGEGSTLGRCDDDGVACWLRTTRKTLGSDLCSEKIPVGI